MKTRISGMVERVAHNKLVARCHIPAGSLLLQTPDAARLTPTPTARLIAGPKPRTKSVDYPVPLTMIMEPSTAARIVTVALAMLVQPDCAALKSANPWLAQWIHDVEKSAPATTPFSVLESDEQQEHFVAALYAIELFAGELTDDVSHAMMKQSSCLLPKKSVAEDDIFTAVRFALTHVLRNSFSSGVIPSFQCLQHSFNPNTETFFGPNGNIITLTTRRVHRGEAITTEHIRNKALLPWQWLLLKGMVPTGLVLPKKSIDPLSF
eukprot:PhM_4_TR9768/c0_g1_i1/m.46120